MVKEITTYPTPLSAEYATDIRVFDENLFALIDDLKDTIEANGLQALAAFQIGSYYNVVVLKNEDGTFVELVNPRLIRVEGRVSTQEKTAYFGDLSAEVSRHEKISVVYQDRFAQNHSLQAEGALSILLQRKLDYTFGATFVSKLSKDEKKYFEKKLEFGSDVSMPQSCPTPFVRDKILKVIFYLLVAMVFVLLASLFSDTKTDALLWKYQLYLCYGVFGLQIFYFFYAQYEGGKQSSCTSCQVGNILGTTAISFARLGLIMFISYFIIKP